MKAAPDASPKDELLAAVAEAAERSTRLRVVRDATIRRAGAVATLAEIAKAAGLTRARIHQIIHKEESR